MCQQGGANANSSTVGFMFRHNKHTSSDSQLLQREPRLTCAKHGPNIVGLYSLTVSPAKCESRIKHSRDQNWWSWLALFMQRWSSDAVVEFIWVVYWWPRLDSAVMLCANTNRHLGSDDCGINSEMNSLMMTVVIVDGWKSPWHWAAKCQMTHSMK